MNRTRSRSTALQKMVRISILIAIMLILELTGLGLIKTAGLEIAILLIPVIVGALTCGPTGGAILGAVFGLISLWECISGKSAFGATLFTISPIGAILTCVPTRIIAGWVCGLVFKALVRFDKHKIWSFPVASLVCALLNTALFMGVLCIFYYNTDFIQGFVTMLGSPNVFLFIIGFVGLNGLIEAIVCLVVGAAVSKGVYHITNGRGKKSAPSTLSAPLAETSLEAADILAEASESCCTDGCLPEAKSNTSENKLED